MWFFFSDIIAKNSNTDRPCLLLSRGKDSPPLYADETQIDIIISPGDYGPIQTLSKSSEQKKKIESARMKQRYTIEVNVVCRQEGIF